MHVYDIHEAKTNLFRLIDDAVRGEPCLISKNGVPLVKVEAIHGQQKERKRRVGFLAGKITAPGNFDRMGSTEVEGLFGILS
jgi:antitoxin (DNA-binding transcriptional repressor) of toxin-antitoxin stability system